MQLTNAQIVDMRRGVEVLNNGYDVPTVIKKGDIEEVVIIRKQYKLSADIIYTLAKISYALKSHYDTWYNANRVVFRQCGPVQDPTNPDILKIPIVNQQKYEEMTNDLSMKTVEINLPKIKRKDLNIAEDNPVTIATLIDLFPILED